MTLSAGTGPDRHLGKATRFPTGASTIGLRGDASPANRRRGAANPIAKNRSPHHGSAMRDLTRTHHFVFHTDKNKKNMLYINMLNKFVAIKTTRRSQ